MLKGTIYWVHFIFPLSFGELGLEGIVVAGERHCFLLVFKDGFGREPFHLLLFSLFTYIFISCFYSLLLKGQLSWCLVFGPFCNVFEGGWLEGRVLLPLRSTLGMVPNSEFLVERVGAGLFALALPSPELLLIRGGLVL